MITVYSNKQQLIAIANYLTAYMKIPFFQDDSIPGKIMEKIVSLVKGGRQLGTYDYVDVCIENKVGWSVKSTKESTPLTWKRAKIKNSAALIPASEINSNACQDLGNLIIDYCNSHAHESMNNYNLEKIGYSRLIFFENNTAMYFERELSNTKNKDIFNKDDYTWKWSTPKITEKKEQLNALHGTHVKTGNKAFAWHGKGENQLHFNGEKEWWPTVKAPEKIGDIEFSTDNHAIAFKLPESKVDWEELVSFLNEVA